MILNEGDIYKRVLDFLTEFKTRQDIEEKFLISKLRAWRMIKWYKKINLISEVKKFDKKNNRFKPFYKKI